MFFIALQRSSRLAQRHQASNLDDSGSEDDNSLATILENKNENAFFMIGIAREVATETGEPLTVSEALLDRQVAKSNT